MRGRFILKTRGSHLIGAQVDRSGVEKQVDVGFTPRGGCNFSLDALVVGRRSQGQVDFSQTPPVADPNGSDPTATLPNVIQYVEGDPITNLPGLAAGEYGDLGDVVTPGIDTQVVKFANGVPRSRPKDELISFSGLDEPLRRSIIQAYLRKLDNRYAALVQQHWTLEEIPETLIDHGFGEIFGKPHSAAEWAEIALAANEGLEDYIRVQTEAQEATIAELMQNLDLGRIPAHIIDEMVEDQLAKIFHSPDMNETNEGAQISLNPGLTAVVIEVPSPEGGTRLMAFQKYEVTRTVIEPFSNIGQRTIREGWFYRFVGSPPAGTTNWEAAAQFVFIPQTAESLAGFEASLTFALHFVPTAAAIDYFSQGKYGEGAISAAGDLLRFAKVGTRLFFAAKEAGMADDAAKALIRTTATKFGVAINRADAMIEGIIGGYRIKGAIDAAIKGDTSDAAGKAGESLLRLIGAKTALSELRKLKAMAPNSAGRKLFGHHEYEIADPAKAAKVKQSLLDYYNKNADFPSINYVDDLVDEAGNAKAAMIDKTTGRIDLDSSLLDPKYSPVHDGYLMEELPHFHQLHTRDLFGKLDQIDDLFFEDNVVGRLLRSGLRIFDPR